MATSEMRLPRGTLIRITDGALRGLEGVVEAPEQNMIRTRVEFCGVPLSLALPAHHIEEAPYTTLSLAEMWSQIEDTISMRGFYQRKLYWWAARAPRCPLGDLLKLEALSAEFEPFEREVDAQAEDATRRLRSSFLKAFSKLSPLERGRKWKEEAPLWCGWTTIAQQTIDALERDLLDDKERQDIIARALLRGPAGGISEQELGAEAIASAIEDRLTLARLLWSESKAIRRCALLIRSIEAPPASPPSVDLRDLDDAQTLQIYADELIERGDPLGELIALDHRAESEPKLKPKGDALFLQHQEPLLGPLRYFDDALSLRRTRGFITVARIRPIPSPEEIPASVLTKALLTRPIAALLQELYIAEPDASEEREGRLINPLLEVLGQRPLLSLKTLMLGPHEDLDNLDFDQVSPIGDLSPLGRATPNLERLFVNAAYIEARALCLPKLRALSVLDFGEGADARLSLQAPKLSRLRLMQRQEDLGTLYSFTKDLSCTRLQKLSLVTAWPPSMALKAFACAEPTLVELELALPDADMTDPDELAQALQRFPKLQRLSFLGSALPPAQVQRLARPGLQIIQNAEPPLHEL